jgi:2'-hydroxyisoflavone reductase
MRLLFLGGTAFVGRHMVEAARARGHEVTLFHRGQTNPDLFPDVEHLYGDRERDLAVLGGRRWEAAIDTSGYLPRVVRHAAERLADVVDHYTFISARMVYAGIKSPPAQLTEQAPVMTLSDPTIEEVTGETYGPLKALCEQVVEQVLPGRVLTIRPCVIVGPHDPEDRFIYWLRRIDRGGTIVVLGPPQQPVQLIDARDLAEWLLRMIEAGAVGIYNATGPQRPLHDILAAMQQVSGRAAELVWVDAAFLKASRVIPAEHVRAAFPLCLSPALPGLNSIDSAKAIAAGLTVRPFATTIADTLEWDRRRPQTPITELGLTTDQERRIVQMRQRIPPLDR